MTLHFSSTRFKWLRLGALGLVVATLPFGCCETTPTALADGLPIKLPTKPQVVVAAAPTQKCAEKCCLPPTSNTYSVKFKRYETIHLSHR